MLEAYTVIEKFLCLNPTGVPVSRLWSSFSGTAGVLCSCTAVHTSGACLCRNAIDVLFRTPISCNAVLLRGDSVGTVQKTSRYVFALCYSQSVLPLSELIRVICTLDGVRRSAGSDVLGRAKRRALKLFIIIAVAYIICWTPTHVIAAW